MKGRTVTAADDIGRLVRILEESVPPKAADVAWSVARRLGDLQIVCNAGRGETGVAYRARQRSLDRRVPLKVLHLAGLLGRRQLQRFENEAPAAAQLDPLHSVGVLAVGCARGAYYAMQFIEFRTLVEAIAERRGTSRRREFERMARLPVAMTEQRRQ